MNDKNDIYEGECSDKYNLVDIVLQCRAGRKKKRVEKSIEILGIDTEADQTGDLIMVCVSNGDIFSKTEWLEGLLQRKYRNQHFVAYNLGYDEGHLIRHLPYENLQELRLTNKTELDGIKYTCIPKKMLKLSKKGHSITVWDMLQFYGTSLQKASELYLNDSKLDQDVTQYDEKYIQENWNNIAKYCIYDADLTRRLGQRIIEGFEKIGLKCDKLYSAAYISSVYFATNCHVPDIDRYIKSYPDCLQSAFWSYAGGKFEVTRKGCDYYYEYDINSAYPYEMSNLVDISDARVLKSEQYERSAKYGFLDCIINIKEEIKHPVRVLCKGLCLYPVGKFRANITKNEYEYLVKNGVEIDILEGYWLYPKRYTYPYRQIILDLYEQKNEIKKTGDVVKYNAIKKVLNSWYGKHIQLIKQKSLWIAGSYINPFYASIITANVRIRVSEMQQRYSAVSATFTDSIISTKEIPVPCGDNLGDWEFSKQGQGVILGSGIYQIGDECKLRGFHSKMNLTELFKQKKKRILIKNRGVHTWREIIFRNHDSSEINLFTDKDKYLSVQFDKKRIWINDYKYFSDVPLRNVDSIAREIDPELGLL